MKSQVFSSFDEYAVAVQQASIHSTFLGPKRTNWSLSHLDMGTLAIQWGQTGGADTHQGAVQSGGIAIFMPLENAPSLRANGQSFDDRSLITLQAGEEFCIGCDNSSRWFSVHVPIEVLEGADHKREEIASFRSVVRSYFAQAEKLRSAAEQLRVIFQNAPKAFDSTETLNVTARKLTDQVRETLWIKRPEQRTTGRQSIPRQQVVRLAVDFVDDRAGEYLTVQDLAAAARVSERTLRTAFQQSFGVAPVRYLKARTLNQVRAALKEADPARTTVAQIATRFGVWEFGRFAHDYRCLFGELPSESLRHLD
jgi:AraC family transcriptional regulator, ethanolamine operon transcriptional activator